MAYSKDSYEAVRQELSRRRLTAQQRASELHARMRCDPRVCEQEQIMAGSIRKVTAAIANKQAYEQTIAAVQAENLAAQAEIARILKEAGETVTDFEPKYTCQACEDTGYVNGRSCACRDALLREYATAALCRMTGMKPLSFNTLDMTYYSDAYDERLGCSPREHMQSVIEYCQWYAQGFDASRPNLLLSGATGTGKSHVSMAIAAGACKREAHVIYGPVQSLLRVLEAEHFGRADGNTEEMLIGCDLLILDDLGTEFASPFYTSALYAVINGRLLAGRPTVISTNLNSKAIFDHYGEQIASRLIGTYEPLVFVGNDIRQQKLNRRYAE